MNELFVIKGDYIKDFNIKIFNRWGEKLFESNEIGKYWDGTFENKKVQAGMYYYHIEILGEDGNPIYREDGKVLKGPNYFKPDIMGILNS